MTGLPAAATASSASWSSVECPARRSAPDSLVNKGCHPERGRAPKRFLQLGKPESKDLGFVFRKKRRLAASPRTRSHGLHRFPRRLRLEIMRRIRPHLRHGGKGASVIVARVPEQEADAAVLACYAHLGLDVLRRISFRAPGKCLQPGAHHHARVMGDLFETLQRSGDEMFRS